MEEEEEDDEWRPQQFYLDVINVEEEGESGGGPTWFRGRVSCAFQSASYQICVEEEGESGGGPTRFHERASCAFQSASYQVWVLSSFLFLPPPFLGSLCKFAFEWTGGTVRTVGQFRILMDQRNRAGQIVRLGIIKMRGRNSQGEEKKRMGVSPSVFVSLVCLPSALTRERRKSHMSVCPSICVGSAWKLQSLPTQTDRQTCCLDQENDCRKCNCCPGEGGQGVGGGRAGGCEGRCFFFFFFFVFLGPPSFSCGWLEGKDRAGGGGQHGQGGV